MPEKTINSNLLNAIKSKKIIIFCGAGTSCFSGFPSWKELTISILKDLAHDFMDLNPFIQLLESNTLSPLDVLGYVQKHKSRVWDHVTQIIKIKDHDLSLQKIILSLSKRIITTNYDKAFEYASNNSVDVVLSSNRYKLAKLHETKEFIFKIHGDIDNPGECILFKEDYDKLYLEERNAYLLELEKIITDNTILFVGFSLSDPYVEGILHAINKMYNNFNTNHFIITTDKTFPTDRFSHKIIPIHINSYNDLPNEMMELVKYNSITSISSIERKVNKDESKKIKQEQKTILPLVTILRARPIDKTIVLKDEPLAEALSKYSIEIERDYLSLSTLQNVEDAQYLFLFTKVSKGFFLIEDEYLKSDQIGLTEIDENVPGSNVKAIIVFYEGDEYINTVDCSRPCILLNMTGLKHKDAITKFVYYFFTKKQIPNFQSILLVDNHKQISFPNYPKGNCLRKDYIPTISKFLDSKVLNRFVGRKNDLENIIRKLVDLKYESKILTIKGAGGIGKTTLATKAVIELAERKLYRNGVFFIPCQSISSLENFKFEISQCFDLDTSTELEMQIADNFNEKDRLIILDNFETQLNSPQKDKILNLVSFISDYSIIVATSRQRIDFDFEDIYDLRNLTTDEGLELFLSLCPGNFSEKMKLLIRYELVERILNNNPLAIKLIAKGTPPDKDIILLIKELDEDIFKNENIDLIFERPEDINIERTQSLYQSINYSYQLLSEKERFAFEILSIFPDGLRLENFKKFSKSSPKIRYKIEDKDIKNLDDKSLLERRNNLLRLQSIVSRFAENKFKNRDESIRHELYTNAFNFNMSLLKILSDRRQVKRGRSVRLFDMHYNNFLKTLESLEWVNSDKVKKLEFISLVSNLFTSTNQEEQFIQGLKLIRQHFNSVNYGTLLIDCIEASTLYYVRNFDKPFTNLLEIMPFNNLNLLDRKDLIQDHIYYNASSLYECEGYSYELLNMLEVEDNNFYDLIFKLYKLGYLDKVSNILDETLIDDDFVVLEIKNTKKSIDANHINDHIKSIYKKELLEIVQCTYILSKHIDIPLENIKKLVISNPYTKGLIKIMTIPHISNENEIKTAYIEAIKELEHIKFYYLEAIILFCEYLKSIKDVEFESWYNKGYESAKKYKYSYQIYLFEKMVSTNIHFAYNEELYTSKYAPLNPSVENIIKRFISKQKKSIAIK
jgi:hypothetical protein